MNDPDKSLITSGDTPLFLYLLEEAAATMVQYDSKAGTIRRAVPSSPPEQGLSQPSGGNVLGDIGGLIVGEVLTGLLDHYRDQTSHGLDYIPVIAVPEVDNIAGITMYDLVNFAWAGEPESIGCMID